MRFFSRRKEQGADRLEGFANYATQSENRRLLWTARLLAVVVVVEALAALSMALALYGLTPLKTVEPMLLTLAPREDQIVHVEPYRRDGSAGFRLLTEFLVRDFVKTAHTIVPNLATMRELWGRKLFRLAAPDVFALLRESYAVPAQELVEEGRSRGVEFRGDPRLIERNRGVLYWQIAFDTVDTVLTQEVDRQSWIASIVVEFLPLKVSYEDRYINPLGFQVVGYTVARNDVAE